MFPATCSRLFGVFLVLALGACTLLPDVRKPPSVIQTPAATSLPPAVDPPPTRRDQVMAQLRQNQYLRVSETASGEIIAQVRSGKLYRSDGIEIDPPLRPVFEHVAALLNAHPWLNVRVIGHTDNLGAPEHNLALSVRRAERAGALLIALGVASQRVRYEGRGDREPLVPNTSAEGRDVNRRVELVLTDTSAASQAQDAARL